MARPYKRGLEYFPLDVRIYEDSKLVTLNYHAGPQAQDLYIRLLTLVYANGYYLESSRSDLIVRLHLMMGPRWIKADKVGELFDSCVEYGLFDEELALQGVITSASIQKQFVLSTRRRQNVDIDKYWLLDSATMQQLGVLLSMSKLEVNENTNLVTVNNNLVNVDCSTQSKSKKKSKRDKEDKLDKRVHGTPSMHFLTKILIEDKYIGQYPIDYDKYDNLFKSTLGEYTFADIITVVRYIVKYSKQPGVIIDDRFGFFKTSLLNNLDRIRRGVMNGNESIEDIFTKILQQVRKNSSKSKN